MKKRYFFVLIFFVAAMAGLLLYSNFTTRNNKNQYNKLEYNSGSYQGSNIFPGEFEKQQAIWMQWPSEVYNTGDRSVNPAMISIIKAFDPYIRVNVMARSVEEITAIKNLLKTNGYTGTNAHFYVINHYSIWTRDVGPIFVKDSAYRLNVVDFGFNNYSRDGNPAYINTEKQVDKLTAQTLKLPVISSSLVSEGGAIESNGRGVMMTTESVVLKRNPGMSKQQIENEYKRVLGVKKIIWLKKGLAEDDGITGGHINEIARFASTNTVLLAQILPKDRYTNSYSQESYLRLEENYNILKNSTDQDGKPFKIIRIPMPPTAYSLTESNGKLPVRSYLNYAVTNGAVLIPLYWKAGRADILKTTEDNVKAMFKSIFLGRNIIGIDAENINKWGGGIHCITQHMPAY
jgi:Peptidylarginine deiminase and related enzymes